MDDIETYAINFDRLETSKDDDLEIGASSDDLSIERALKVEEYKGKKQDREQRKDFAERIFSFLVVYMVAVCFILFLSGITVNHFFLSDTV